MTIQDAWNLYERQGGRCALTGWDLVISAPKVSSITASLDRINSKEGYSPNNTQWVHKDVNIAKNVYSQEYFVQMCRSVTEKNAKQ